ncbi:MAG: hypothetical protein ACYTGB_04310, partial [Planctomycetota bacterium]
MENPAELSLIGHGASAGGDEVRSSPRGYNPLYEGYCFEFGAEHQSCAKLARHGHDVLGRPGLTPEPGRRYRLEMAYEDGWLFCFIDGERIFSYRELFPLSGSSVGFYAHGRGAHLRPLEIHRQNWGLQPAMRMADDLYRHGFSQAALDRYLLVADQNPDRLEGDEARLKIGICLAEQD